MSGFLGGAMADPIAMGLMGLAQGFGNAAMPSRMPIPLGAAFGSAAGGMQEAMTNAQKLRLLAQQEARLGQQNEIQRDQWNAAKGMMDRLPGMFGQMPAGLGGGNVAPEDVAAAPTRPMGGGLQANLVNSESGGRPDVVNAQGYSGKYQIGAPLLVDLGMYNAGQNEGIGGPRLGGWGGAKWSGQFNIPGFPNVKTHADFLRNPDAQDAVYNAAMARNDKLLEQAGAYNSVGQTINGVPVTREGLLKGAWLGGVGGVTSWLKSGGAMDPADANGTKVSSYIRSGAAAAAQPAAMAGGGQPSASADMGAPPAASMPPAQVKAVNNIAQRAWQQASQLQSAAMAMTMNPFTKDMAPILMKQAEEYLKVGMWQPTILPNGMQGFQHALTGEVKELSQPRTVESWQGGRSTRMLDQPGVTSEAPPAAPIPLLRGSNVEMVEPNSGRTIGQKPLTLEEQSAAGVQSGQRGMTPSQASVASAANRAGAERTATNTAEEWKSTRAAALDAGQRIAVLDRVEQALNNFTPGIMADRKLWLGQIAEQFGASTPINASEGEILKGLRSRVQLALTPRGQGQITESERGLIGAQFEVMMSTPQGAKEMISMIRRLDQIDMDVAKIYADNAEKNGGQPNPIEVQREVQAYLQANPKPVMPEMRASQQPAATPPAGFRILNVR